MKEAEVGDTGMGPQEPDCDSQTCKCLPAGLTARPDCQPTDAMKRLPRLPQATHAARRSGCRTGNAVLRSTAALPTFHCAHHSWQLCLGEGAPRGGQHLALGELQVCKRTHTNPQRVMMFLEPIHIAIPCSPVPPSPASDAPRTGYRAWHISQLYQPHGTGCVLRAVWGHALFRKVRQQRHTPHNSFVPCLKVGLTIVHRPRPSLDSAGLFCTACARLDQEQFCGNECDISG